MPVKRTKQTQVSSIIHDSCAWAFTVFNDSKVSSFYLKQHATFTFPPGRQQALLDVFAIPLTDWWPRTPARSREEVRRAVGTPSPHSPNGVGSIPTCNGHGPTPLYNFRWIYHNGPKLGWWQYVIGNVFKSKGDTLINWVEPVFQKFNLCCESSPNELVFYHIIRFWFPISNF